MSGEPSQLLAAGFAHQLLEPGDDGLALGADVGRAAGVLIYDGSPVLGAPPIGYVTAGPARVPLLGIRVDLSRIQDPRCPFFPDSLLQ